MLDHMDGYSHSSEATDAETHSSTTPPAAAMRKKRGTKNKRRFSDEQIKSLESMFQTESRLEPIKKMQLARELGLQPRQVAIWFQNKRARWKSKQIERDHTILRANYNCLASRFDALKKEKQALLIQLQMLNDRLKKPPAEETQEKGGNSMYNESENGDTNRSEPEAKASPSTERSENVLGVVSDGDSGVRVGYFGLQEDEPGLVNFVEHGEGTLTSPKDWGSFDSGDLLGQSTSDTDYQLWDFWS